MDVTLGQHYDPTTRVSGVSRQTSNRAERKEFSLALATALYFAGVLVETLGLGLIAAYGWLLAGGAIAFCGLLVATIGNNRWPAANQGVSSVTLLKDCFSTVRSTGVASARRNNRQV